MAKYLVTGCAGFIASRVTELLLEAGHEVLGVDELNDAYDPRLKRWRLQRLGQYPGFRFAQLDIVDTPELARAFAEFAEEGDTAPVDAVVNLAARAGVRASVRDPHVYYHTNVNGTLALLECCRRLGIRKFLLASTSSLYGAHNTVPYREEADTDHPLSPYAASKKAAETLCHTYHHLHGMDVSVVRYFTVYGPAGRPDMSVFRFIRWIAEGTPITVYGDGTQSRDFTYVDDIAAGTIAALQPVGYEVVNLGGDRPVVLADMIAEIERLLDRRAEIRRQPAHPADVSTTWADVTKARELLQWQPTVPLEEGLRRSVAWYRENRELAERVSLGEV